MLRDYFVFRNVKNNSKNKKFTLFPCVYVHVCVRTMGGRLEVWLMLLALD